MPFDNEFIKEAYKVKKYAFVSDFIRVYALYKYGGVYMDSDVELTASLDPFLNHSFFISQTRNTGGWVGKKYTDAIYLSNCYNSCRKNLRNANIETIIFIIFVNK